jgi:hypothetical protein
MLSSLKALDRLLRGESTRPGELQSGRVDVPATGLSLLILALGATYGLCMGLFSVVGREVPSYLQIPSSMIKVPALFVLTLLITLPSLYVFNALVGSRLRGETLVKLLVASMAITLAVLASFGPIVAFFSLTTNSYPFMIILNVLVFALSGAIGLRFLIQTMQRLSISSLFVPPPVPPSPVDTITTDGPTLEPAKAQEISALAPAGERTIDKNVKSVFVCWVIVFGLVGAQMSWVLRPFIGNPDQPFTWFRPRESNFFEAVRRNLAALFQ